MDEKIYQLIGADYPGNRAEDIKNLDLGWMIGFLFVVSFLGLFSLVPLQKVDFQQCICRFFSLFYTNVGSGTVFSSCIYKFRVNFL